MIENNLFISKAMNNMLPPILKTGFSSAKILTTIVQLSLKKSIFIKTITTNNFRKLSITVSVIDSWDKSKDQMGEIALKDLRPNCIK